MGEVMRRSAERAWLRAGHRWISLLFLLLSTCVESDEDTASSSTCRVDDECRVLGENFACVVGRCRERAASDRYEQADAAAIMTMPSVDAGSTTGVEAAVDAGFTPVVEAVVDANFTTSMDASSQPDAPPSEDAAPLGVLCDGSDSMRLGLSSDGGQVHDSYAFTNPYGHVFLFVDGMCRYYASADLSGVRTGTLSAAQASELERAIGWTKLSSWSALPNDLPCFDAGSVVIQQPGAAASCTCGCDATKPAELIAAIGQVNRRVQELVAQGTPLNGPVRALATPKELATGNELTWPLSTPMANVPALIEANPAQLFYAKGALFVSASDAAQLRMLRAQALARRDIATAQVPVRDAGKVYEMYVRDELPDDVVRAIDALRGANRP